MDKLEFVKSVNLEELFNKIKEVLGIEVEFEVEIKTDYRNSPYINIESNNLVNQSGIFAKVFSDVRVQTFNTSIAKDEKTNEYYYWLTVSLRHQLKEGGSNGVKLLTAWYQNNEWKFELVD